ncbi:Fibronectin type III domain protein (plasmid) [Bacillus thuringiensis MC28]|nr:Fibronectin type III domain protein [Bacillus thuringiensis MC28]
MHKGEYILVHAPGTTAKPAIKRMTLLNWEFIHNHENDVNHNTDYSNFVYLRYKDKGAAFRAADYAYNHF